MYLTQVSKYALNRPFVFLIFIITCCQDTNTRQGIFCLRGRNPIIKSQSLWTGLGSRLSPWDVNIYICITIWIRYHSSGQLLNYLGFPLKVQGINDGISEPRHTGRQDDLFWQIDQAAENLVRLQLSFQYLRNCFQFEFHSLFITNDQKEVIIRSELRIQR